jgi:hypothetical protein
VVSFEARYGVLLFRFKVVIIGAFISLAPLPVSSMNPPDNTPDKTKPAASILVQVDPAKNSQTFTWEQLKSGGAVFVIRNPGGESRKLRDVSEVLFERLPQASIAANGKAPAGGQTTFAGKVEAVPAQAEIKAYESQRFQLGIGGSAPPVQPVPGVYLAWVVVDEADSKNQPLSQQIRVTVPGPQPLLAKASTTIYRLTPFGCWQSHEVAVPLLNPEVKSILGGRKVGALRKSTGDWVAVKWADPQSTAEGDTAWLSIDDPPSAGTYDGDLVLNEDPDKVPLNVSVVAKDIIVWPILVIVLGTYLAYKAKRYLGLVRITWSLREQEAELGTFFKQNEEEFQTNPNTPSIGDYSIAADVNDQRKKICQLLDKLELTVSTNLDMTNLDYKEVCDRLRALQTGIAAWPALGKSLASLAQQNTDVLNSIDKAEMESPGKLPNFPAFCLLVQNLLQGKEIPVAQIAPLTQQADNLTALVTAWQKTYTQAGEQTNQFRQTRSQVNAPTPEEKTALGALTADVTTMWVDLLETTTSDDLTKANGDVSKVVADLANFPSGRRLVFAMRSMPVSFLLEGFRAHQAQKAVRSAATLQLNLPENDQLRAELLQKSIARRDVEAAVFAGFVGLLTGLNTLYLGKPFGTLQDYVGVFLWAAGTKVALDLLTAALDKFVLTRAT